MTLVEAERGIEAEAPSYRLLLERAGGYAAREVEVFGAGRLDRFDRPGEGAHPTCMYFDNITVNSAFQLAHYGQENSRVSAAVEGATVKLAGKLLPITEKAQGEVRVEKEMRFEDDLYDVDVRLRFDGTGPVDYVSAWWDVNDRWLRAMRSSAGVFVPLRVGVGDSFGEDLNRTWRPMRAMDRGAGVWMEMIGEKCSVLVSLLSLGAEELSAGGIKFWDGPDDADEGEGVSHGCINLDVINCELSGATPLDVAGLSFSYRVFLSGPTILRT